MAEIPGYIPPEAEQMSTPLEIAQANLSAKEASLNDLRGGGRARKMSLIASN